MAQKLRILFLPKWYPNKFDSLDGNFIENHAKAVAPFCDLAVLFVHSDADLNQAFEEIQNSPSGFQEIRVYFKKPHLKWKALNRIVTFIRYFKAQLKGYRLYLKSNKQPDLTHIHVLGRTAPLALFLKFSKQIPFLVTEHWSGYHKRSGAYTGLLKKWITRFTVRNANAITTVSTDLMNAMLSHQLKGEYQIVPNVIDINTFTPNYKKQNKKIRFIHISNLSKVPKNLHQVIFNLNDLAVEGFDFEFILVGYGEEEDQMLELINKSALEPLTTFRGKLTMEEVAKELAQADAMLLFSLYENQPVVMLESFACGCPAVVSDVGGIAEIMKPELGILVKSEDNNGFKDAIRHILTKETIFDPHKIREYAVTHFSEEIVGKQFLELYTSIHQGSNIKVN